VAAQGQRDDDGFSDLLGAARPEAAGEPGSRDRHLGKPATAFSGQGVRTRQESANGRETGPTGRPAVQTGADDRAAKPRKDHAEEPAADQRDMPLQDRMPLLIALQDLRRFSATANASRDASAGDAGPAPYEPAGLPIAHRPKPAVARERAEAGPKPDPAALAEAQLGEVETPGSDASAALKRDSALRAAPLPHAQTADLPGTRPMHPTPLRRGVEDSQPPTRSEPTGQAPQPGRLDIISEQSFPAPPQSSISQAALSVIDAVAAENGKHPAFAATSSASAPAGSVAVSTHILKIELHPAELGMVTASLRLVGEQLSIELKPETGDAYRRLSVDSESIVKTLRGLGFEIDKVTVMQPSIAVPTAARPDATAALPTPTSRDHSSFTPGNPGGGNGGAGGQQPGRHSAGNPHDEANGRGTPPSRERAGNGMFI
jgi:chemotaxis protein MotD